MIEFDGFPARIKKFTPIPNLVFSSLLPQITDITELKVLFYIFELIYPKKGSLRFVSLNELLSQLRTVNDPKEADQESLYKAMEGLVKKHAILHVVLKNGENQDDLYFINDEANQLAVEKIKNREIIVPGLKSEVVVPEETGDSSDIFTLYEQNIGMLTPLLADELKEAKKQYSEIWIKNAIKEAVAQNKRSWRYISRILEHWSIEGKDDGTYRGNLKKNTDPDKFIKGRYGHMVQR
jgi:DNA replication protein